MGTHFRMQRADARTNPVEDRVCWKWSKSLWWTDTFLATAILAPLTFSWDAAAVAFGLKAGEWDLGWLVLRGQKRGGLVWNLAAPEKRPARPGHVALPDPAP